MKQVTILIALFVFLVCSASIAQQQYQVPVMILGTYHMSNPGADAANIQADDVMTEKRQAELAALAEQLAEFKPTKIAIESPYGDTVRPMRYQQLLDGGSLDSLGPNETYQIGFRLAQLMGHDTIYPIDHRMDINPPSIGNLFGEYPDKLAYFEATIAGVQDSLNNWTENVLYKKSISEFLAFMNTDEMIELNHSLYLELVKELWGGTYFSGAEMLSKWYERNLLIFQNLIRITDFDTPGEKILIVMGQGHAKLLKDLTQDANFYEYVPAIEYLQEND